MGILDGLLGGNGNIDLADLAGKIGIAPDELKNGAESLLSKLAGGNDAASAAQSTAAETGLPLDKLQALLPALASSFGHADVNGLLGSLQEKAGGLLGAFDKDGDGNPLNDLAGMAKGLFGKS